MDLATHGENSGRPEVAPSAAWLRLLVEINGRAATHRPDQDFLWRALAALIDLRAVLSLSGDGPCGVSLAWPRAGTVATNAVRDLARSPESRSWFSRVPAGQRVTRIPIDREQSPDWRPLLSAFAKSTHETAELLRIELQSGARAAALLVLVRVGGAALDERELDALDTVLGYIEASSRIGGTRRVDALHDYLRRAAGVAAAAPMHAEPPLVLRPPVPEPVRDIARHLAESLRLTDAEARAAWAVYQVERLDEAARGLNISPHTLRTHLKRVFQKLAVHSRAALMVRIADALHGPARVSRDAG